MKKRKIDVAVISDVHLGTFGCHADELLAYLSSIQPNILVLNGDIIDAWQYSDQYFPGAHLKVLKKIIGMASSGVEVYYITGSHDEMIRKFSTTIMGSFKIVDRLVLELDGKKAWFFHGNVFDVSIRNAKWLIQFGSFGYDLLIRINRFAKWVLLKMGKERYSVSIKMKTNQESALKHCNAFERAVVDLAIENGYNYVICGYTHHPKKEIREHKNGQCTYLNSGDWVDSLTALEYSLKRWKIYRYSHDKLSSFFADEDIKAMDIHDLIAKIKPHKNTEEKGESTD